MLSGLDGDVTVGGVSTEGVAMGGRGTVVDSGAMGRFTTEAVPAVGSFTEDLDKVDETIVECAAVVGGAIKLDVAIVGGGAVELHAAVVGGAEVVVLGVVGGVIKGDVAIAGGDAATVDASEEDATAVSASGMDPDPVSVTVPTPAAQGRAGKGSLEAEPLTAPLRLDDC